MGQSRTERRYLYNIDRKAVGKSYRAKGRDDQRIEIFIKKSLDSVSQMLYNRLTKQERGFDSESGESENRGEGAYRHGNRKDLCFRRLRGERYPKAEGNSARFRGVLGH